jgi:hypothetical protein
MIRPSVSFSMSDRLQKKLERMWFEKATVRTENWTTPPQQMQTMQPMQVYCHDLGGGISSKASSTA